MEVFVKGNSRKELLGNWISGCNAGIAMRYPGSKFLERYIRQPREHAWVYRLEAFGHVHHARTLKSDRVN